MRPAPDQALRSSAVLLQAGAQMVKPERRLGGGVTRGKLPRFVRNFMAEVGSIADALRRYVAAVKDGRFPDCAVHGY